MTKKKSSRAHAPAPTSPLIPHLLLLATQANEQLLELALTVDAHASLDTAIEPFREEDTVEIFAPPSQLAVLRRALKNETQQQLKALAHTADALHACAAELAGKP